jgi:hypothetical protein
MKTRSNEPYKKEKQEEETGEITGATTDDYQSSFVK